jgi:hypothetical protein
MAETMLLNIPDIEQKSPVWCWAAVSKQIIHGLKDASPKQCKIVSDILDKDCCEDDTGCQETGTIDDIQLILNRYTGRYTQTTGPLGFNQIKELIYDRKPILMSISLTEEDSHIVVIRGFEEKNGKKYLYINDPLRIFNQKESYHKVFDRWNIGLIFD